ncbi:DoxX family protein [Mycobacterium intracellulare]|uniref:DoxX family protein n=1 Tax=Mycobacterium intracellulare TaxID=1767 RepID=UPI001CDA2A2C|nr:DoxX family protein [Mycobacterium intracellulare]MCA2276614.1 DoxX family protein [Mycobacterium intracellulare]MCA2328395.1 DoxX family protein [Mycobacterium intracellulare]
MDVAILIGRVLFAAIFVGGSIGHFTNTATMSAHTESMGLRPGRLFVLGSAVWMSIAAALLLVGAWIDVAALMLFVFLIPTAFVMHRFWTATDPETKATEQIHFLKDLSLAGGALMLFGFAVKAGGSLDYTVTGPLFS